MRVYIKKDETTVNDSADISCFLKELDIVLPASATDIICEDALDFSKNREENIRAIVSKMRYGSRLVITGLDVDEFARELVNRNISSQDACNILYGDRVSASTINIMIGYLRECGIEIVNCRLQGIFYYILATRNARN
jgi:hypothetical protein